MSQMETAIAYYKQTDDNYRNAREKYREQESSLATAKSDVRRLEMEITQKEADLPGSVGTGKEDAALEAIEALRTSLRRAKDRARLLENNEKTRTLKLDKARSFRHSSLERVMGHIVEAEMARFPEEARQVLARAYSVAVRMDGMEQVWGRLLKSAMQLPEGKPLAQLGDDVLNAYIGGDDDPE